MSEKLIILNYNIDGLNSTNLQYRIDIILSIIFSENADVIHLQEVVHDVYDKIELTMRHNGYQSCTSTSSTRMPYFTLTFIKNMFCEQQCYRAERKPYLNIDSRSQQGRDMIQVRFRYQGLDWLFINSHLESQGTMFKSQGSTARQGQLTEIFHAMHEHHVNGPAICSGDFNIRDMEASKVLEKFPKNSIKDACMEVVHHNHRQQQQPPYKDILKGGKQTMIRKYDTWFLPGDIPSRFSARYDRIYSYSTSDVTTTTMNALKYPMITPVEFKILGGDSIYEQNELQAMDPAPTYHTPSDHRAILAIYSISNSSTSSNTTNSITSSSNNSSIANNNFNSNTYTNNSKITTSTVNELRKRKSSEIQADISCTNTTTASINNNSFDNMITTNNITNKNTCSSNNNHNNVIIIDD